MNDYDKEMIGKLKAKLSHLVTPDFNDFDFLRWLQGHDYDLDIITPKLQHHFRFIRSLDFSQEVFRVNERYKRYYTDGLLGLTGKDDNFIYIDSAGALDGDGIVKSVAAWEFVVQWFYRMEKHIMRSVRDHENTVGRQSGIVTIQDLDGLSINPINLSLVSGTFKNLCQLLLNHYAEVLQKLIMVNVPSFLYVFLNLLKPILPAKTKRKIIILGSNWKSDILNHVEADALPVRWGGNMVDENNDPNYGTKVVIPGMVPVSLYWKQTSKDPSMDDLTLLSVKARQCSFITVEIQELGSFIKWFYHADKDWGFGVFFTEEENETDTEKMEMVYPQIDYAKGPTIVPESAKIKCKRIGFYKLYFNNNFSRFTKLQIRYKVDIVKK